MILPTLRNQRLEEQRPYLFASAIFHRLVRSYCNCEVCGIVYEVNEMSLVP